jgi:hypothetical protein
MEREVPFIETTAGEVLWRILPQCREQLLGTAGLRLDEWFRAGLVRIIKHGPHRSVYAVSLPGLSVYIKHNRVSDARAWLRQLVRPSKARMECERALNVAARQVPTIVPLAIGERSIGAGRRESYLITQALPKAVALDAYLQRVFPQLEPQRQTVVRQRLAAALGQFMARLHEAGIYHPDLHAGNVLIRLDTENQPSLYLVDLHSIHLGPPLNWKASRDNLVVFNRWFHLHASQADRFRFWKAYFHGRAESAIWPELPGTAPRAKWARLAVEVECRTLRSNVRFWRQRERRCLLTNRHYRRLNSSGIVGHAVADLDHTTLTPFLLDPDEPFRRPGVTVLKDSPSSKVIEFELAVNGITSRVIYKRFSVKSKIVPWLSLVRLPQALRSWVHGHGLLARGLPTARPLLVLHRRCRGLLREGYLLSLKVPDAVELPRFLEQLQGLPTAERTALLRDRIEQVARCIRELHRRQVSQRDLKGANILTTKLAGKLESQSSTSSAGIPASHVWLIDLTGVRTSRRLSGARRIQNLARLHASIGRHALVTRTDKLRFLRTYLQWGLSGRSRWKTWWRAIEKATRIKMERNARNGRPLS